MSSNQLLEQLQSYSTCDLSDALIQLGIVKNCFIPDLKLIDHASNSFMSSSCKGAINPQGNSHIQNKVVLAGPAHTVEFVHAHDPLNNTDALETNLPLNTSIKDHHVDCASPGSVIVIRTPQDSINAVWGGLMTTRSKYIGVKGAVIEGRIRDIDEHVGFPVYYKKISTLGAKPFVRLKSVNEPFQLGSHSNYPVLVRPGDMIVGDLHGVIVIPIEHVDAVLEKCAKIVQQDELCKKAVEEGMTLKESFKKFRN